MLFTVFLKSHLQFFQIDNPSFMHRKIYFSLLFYFVPFLLIFSSFPALVPPHRKIVLYVIISEKCIYSLLLGAVDRKKNWLIWLHSSFSISFLFIYWCILRFTLNGGSTFVPAKIAPGYVFVSVFIMVRVYMVRVSVRFR